MGNKNGSLAVGMAVLFEIIIIASMRFYKTNI